MPMCVHSETDRAKVARVKHGDASEWPPPSEASLLDVLLAAVARLETIDVRPWNIWVEPPRTVMITLSERPTDALAEQLLSVLEPLRAEPHWHEVFTERETDIDDDDDDDDDDDGGPDGCSVCGGPGPHRICTLDSSAQPGGGWAIASTWYLCSECFGAIAARNPDVLKSRLQPEDRAAPYADVLVEGLLSGISTDR
jgi:hypothetical protein